MSDARIVLKKPPYFGSTGSYHVMLIAGLRRVYLPDSGGYSFAASKVHAAKRARWWSERTGIPFEEPADA